MLRAGCVSAGDRARALRARRRAFGASRDGNIAILFVFVFALLMFFTGGAVDFTRYNAVRADLIESMDAAGLAIAQIDAMNGLEVRNLSDDDREEYLKTYGREFFMRNFRHAHLVTDLDIDFEITDLTITPIASGRLRTLLLPIGEVLVGADDPKLKHLSLASDTEITRSQLGNVEVGVVLDITGSMGPPHAPLQKLTDMKDAAKELVEILVRNEQTDYYTKVALVPYSMGVNVGPYAAQVRGAIAGPRPISNVAWKDGSGKNITGVSYNSSSVTVTANSHGFSNGDTVWISGVSATSSGCGWSTNNRLDNRINNQAYTVSNRTSNTFRLQGVSGSGWCGSYSSSSNDYATECVAQNCEIVVTASAHGFSTNDYVRITDVGGLTYLNNNTFRITRIDASNFRLQGSDPASGGNYTSGGNAWCTTPGCEYFHFQPHSGSMKTFQVTTCASERTGAQAYTDVSPQTAYTGRVYAGSGNTCPSAQITPLSKNKQSLLDAIDALTHAGSTAGHIGIAWGWYLVSPNFGYMFPQDSRPAAYDDEETTKVVVIMTDGEFNTPYCNGVIAKDAGTGSGAASDHINCNATNGSSFDQAEALCDAIKAQDIRVYTVGFMIGGMAEAQEIMQNCASGPPYVYIADDGAALKNAFANIARDIARLHISR